MKQDESTAVTDRRQWIASLIRNGTLGGIAVMATYLVGRQWASGCPILTANCKSCRQFSRCELPLAQSVRTTRVDKEQS